MDPYLMKQVAVEFMNRFAETKPTKILTVEASGIAPAVMLGYLMELPVVFAKKKNPSTMSDFLATKVRSFTKQKDYTLVISREYLQANDRVLFIDDFLAFGNAGLGIIDLCRQAGAEIVGMGFIIEKEFQGGRKVLVEAGMKRIESLAIIESLDNNQVKLKGLKIRKVNVYEEARRCLLCQDAPCTKACRTGDPARAIRAIRFDNHKPALQWVKDCTDADLERAEQACIHYNWPLRIKEMLRSIHPDDVDDSHYPQLNIDFCGIPCENCRFVLPSCSMAIASSTTLYWASSAIWPSAASASCKTSWVNRFRNSRSLTVWIAAPSSIPSLTGSCVLAAGAVRCRAMMAVIRPSSSITKPASLA